MWIRTKIYGLAKREIELSLKLFLQNWTTSETEIICRSKI